MRDHFYARCIVGIALCTLTACSLLVNTEGLSDSFALGDGPRETAAPTPEAGAENDGSADSEASTDSAVITTSISCRGLHASHSDAGTGAYEFALDGGGVVERFCDMDSFDGGWTLVTPTMVVEDKAVQDYNDGGARVNVERATNDHGGVQFSVNVTVENCGMGFSSRPSHYFLVGELDTWRQIMATYTFTQLSDCWYMFGDKTASDTNVFPFDLAADLMDRQMNMARTLAGTSIPFAGLTSQCTETADNFWVTAYVAAPKTARVVMRRFASDRPAGISVMADCGSGAWTLTDIYVR